MLPFLKRHPPPVFLEKGRVDRAHSSGDITRSAGCMWPATVFKHIQHIRTQLQTVSVCMGKYVVLVTLGWEEVKRSGKAEW
jgi:hypothetical protein